MSSFNEQLLLQLLQTCASAEPQPLYPSQFATDTNVERTALDRCLDELRRRGLIKLTEWVRGLGQGCELTDAGRRALTAKKLTAPPAAREGAESKPLTDYNRGEIVRDAVFYPAKPVVGRILLAINIAYFLVGAGYAGYRGLDVGDYLIGSNRDRQHPATHIVVRDLGGLYARAVIKIEAFPELRPEFERILLSSFLHFGLLHLGMNMYCLFSIGASIEAMWGRWRFLVIYLLSGITGGCLVLIIELAFPSPAGAGLTAGASGSIFGIVAAMMVWFGLNYQHLPKQVVDAYRRNIGVNLVLLIGINFVVPNVSWQGHLGGAIGGALVALLLNVQRFHPSATVRWLALAAVPCVPAAFFVAVLWVSGWL